MLKPIDVRLHLSQDPLGCFESQPARPGLVSLGFYFSKKRLQLIRRRSLPKYCRAAIFTKSSNALE